MPNNTSIRETLRQRADQCRTLALEKLDQREWDAYIQLSTEAFELETELLETYKELDCEYPYPNH